MHTPPSTSSADWPTTFEHTTLTCSIEHDPRVMERPPLVGYRDLHPNTMPGRKLELLWHHLGPPAQPADELMHRHYLAAMQQLAENPAFVAARAFYPDEHGMLFAFVRWEPPADALVIRQQPPINLWVGYNARSTYAAAMTAIQGLPAHLLQHRRAR
jgi:hypothetical protein